MTDYSESRFTVPRPDCPVPGYWHSDDDDSTEWEVTWLVAAFVMALQPEYVVETGSAFGQTSQAIGQALQANGHGLLVTLEPDTERAGIVRRRCAGLPVEVLTQSSMDFTPEQEIDFAWFDSLIPLRPRELERYAPFMSQRAVVGFHDTGPHHATRGYLQTVLDSGLLINPLFLPTPRGVCFGRVRGGLI